MIDVPDEELPDARASEQRRCEVQVKVRHVLFIYHLPRAQRHRALVNSHRVRERALEEVVVAFRDT